MFSEKQIIDIVADVLAKDENIEWVESLKEVLYVAEDGMITLVTDFNTDGADIFMSGGTLHVGSWNEVRNEDNGSLQDALEPKLENPTHLDGLEETFATSPTGHQLPDDDKSSLTAEEITAIKANMLYWIKKGYIYAGGADILKLQGYYISDFLIEIYAGYLLYDFSNNSWDTAKTYRISLDISSATYNLIVQTN